jgi:hypothetical protein
MIDHHLQKQILHTLVGRESARFADLRPQTVDSNVATYHIQQLLKQGLIEKREDGRYYLTPQGKIAGTTVSLSKKELFHEAHTVLFLAAKNKNSEWLLRRRLVQPLYGMSGFVHGEPIACEPVAETASEIFKQRTGLSAQFEPRGSGYITLMEGDVHQSFIHFTLLYTEQFEGELLTSTNHGENYWYTGDFSEQDIIPSMKSLIDALENSNEHFYVELTY